MAGLHLFEFLRRSFELQSRKISIHATQWGTFAVPHCPLSRDLINRRRLAAGTTRVAGRTASLAANALTSRMRHVLPGSRVGSPGGTTALDGAHLKRSIASFHQDEYGDWVADFDCLHSQHMRHRPLLENRPWVLDETQRAARVGTHVECAACDAGEMPDGLVRLDILGPFPEEVESPKLFAEWRAPAERWDVLVVLAGSLRFEVEGSRSGSLQQRERAPLPPLTSTLIEADSETAVQVERWGRP